MNFGQRIRELRKKKDLTQRDLAQRVSVDFSYISKIENNKLEHTPSVETIVRLAHALETDELELMELADKLPPILDEFASNEGALQFLRRATKKIKTAKGWQELIDYIEDWEPK